MPPPASGVPPRAPTPRWVGDPETPTTLVLVRHGTTEHSHDGRFSGLNDLPLDDDGRRQVAATAHLLAATDPVDRVLTSPLRRARQTADAIAAQLDVPVTICDDLVEMDFGAWEGATFAEAQQHWPAELAAWLASEQASAPGGESFATVAARARRFVDEVRTTYARQRIVAVSHMGPVKTIVRLALQVPHQVIYRLEVETASVSVIDYFADGACTVKALNAHPS